MDYAHSLPGEQEETWQPLEDHLRQVAELTDEFAAPVAPGWHRSRPARGAWIETDSCGAEDAVGRCS